MDKIEFHKILDFAVEREKDAVQFYTDLQKEALFDAHKEMLQELEDMERSHIIILEKMRNEMSGVRDNAPVEDLKISDFLSEEADIKPDSYQNILLIAMKREEKANLLYSNLAIRYKLENDELSNLFARLANEEAAHKLRFERLYSDNVMKDN